MGTKALPEITKMHVMSFSSEYVGVMRYKFYSDDIEWQQVRLFNENQTLLDFEQILQKYGLLNGQELSDKRLDELDKHKQFLVLSDRQKFAPHLNDQFQRYRERKLLILYQKHIASIKNLKQKSAKYKTKVASYDKKKAKTEAIWSNTSTLQVADGDED
jgi:actin-related protein